MSDESDLIDAYQAVVALPADDREVVSPSLPKYWVDSSPDWDDMLKPHAQPVWEFRRAFDEWSWQRARYAVQHPELVTQAWGEWATIKANQYAAIASSMPDEEGVEFLGEVVGGVINLAGSFQVPPDWLAVAQFGVEQKQRAWLGTEQLMATSPLGIMLATAMQDAGTAMGRMMSGALSGLGSAALGALASSIPVAGALVGTLIQAFSSIPDSDETAYELMAQVATSFEQGQVQRISEIGRCLAVQQARYSYAGGAVRQCSAFEAARVACAYKCGAFDQGSYYTSSPFDPDWLDPAWNFIGNVLAKCSLEDSPRPDILPIALFNWIQPPPEIGLTRALDGEAMEAAWQLALMRAMFRMRMVTHSDVMAASILLTRYKPDEQALPQSPWPFILTTWQMEGQGYPRYQELQVSTMDSGGPGFAKAFTINARSSALLAQALYYSTIKLLVG